MKPVLYRYKNSESVIPVMDGYTPGEGWVPLYGEDEMQAATNAALERAAEVCENLLTTPPSSKHDVDDVERGFNAAARRCAHAIRALKELE